MSRFSSALFVISALFAGCGGGSSGPAVATGGPTPLPAGCLVKVDLALGLKAVARQFHALQSRCGLSDQEVEARIEKL